MYRFYIFTAVFWFAIQATLYGTYARQLNGISLVFVRNVSLIAIGAIALFRVDAHEYAWITPHLFTITRTALCGIAHLILNYEAYKHVPIGITGVLKKWVATLTWFFLWYFLLWEALSTAQYLLIGVVISASLYIARQKSANEHIDIQKHRRWMIFILISGILSTTAWYWFQQYSADMNPFLASYILEASIGGISLFVLPLLAYLTKTPLHITKNTLAPIFILSALAIASTIMFTYALQLWSFALSNALVLCSLPLICFFSYLFYKEKLTSKQIGAILIVIMSLVALKYVS